MQRGLVAIYVLRASRVHMCSALVSTVLIFRPPVSQNNIITFVDDNAGEYHSAPSVSDPTFERGDDTIAGLGDWFSRPVRIRQIQWSENSNIDINFSPWYDYFNNPEIYAKIKGFSRLRCKMHVKLIINASPFQYGLGIMAYKPLATTVNTRVDFSGGVLNNTTNTVDEFIMGLTQRMHAHFMPQYSKGCEMELPFVYYKDWLPLEQGLSHLQDMGVVNVYSYDALRSAATTNASPISIAIYAWATDVKLAGPSMSLQSDEYSERPVSTVASAVANAANALVDIPFLAPFARATNMAATNVGRIARFFGFSNPPLIDPVHSMRLNYTANLCSPDIPTQVEKLSMDPKNELTVDSRTVGLDGEDHMTIKHMLDRDVYFARCTWSATSAPDTAIWSTYINPDVSFVSPVTANLGNGVRVSMTPASLISQMFAHWRGPITYKFVAAASQFHRGRLRLSYDPNGPWSNAELGTARLYQKVWDLSTSNTFEFTVPFMAPSTWLRPFGGATNSFTTNGNRFWDSAQGTPSLPYNNFTGSSPYWNGCLRVDVMNELTAPSNVDAMIFVYINCKDVEFANPQNLGVDFSHAILQSDDITISDSVTQETIPVVDNTDHVYDVYMGEKIVSTRQIIHRANYWDTIRPGFFGAFDIMPSFNILTATWRSLMIKWSIPRLPMPFIVLPPNASNGNTAGFPNWDTWDRSGVANAFGSNARTLPITLLSSCYVGWRGSVVWRGFMEKRVDNTDVQITSLKLNRDLASATGMRPNDLTGPTNVNSAWNTLRGGHVTRLYDGGVDPTGLGGAGGVGGILLSSASDFYGYQNGDNIGVSKAAPHYTPQLEAVVPQYSNLRMHGGNPLYYFPFGSGYVDSSKSYATSGDTFDNIAITMNLTTNRSNTPLPFGKMFDVPAISLYAHGGVDYTNFMFVNVPTLWRYTASATGTVPRLAPENND